METKPKVAVLLSGAGVYDGAEIQEAVFALLTLAQHGAEAVCIAPDALQHHVINHLTGEEMPEQRNILVESARIARGKVVPLSSVSAQDFDALLMPGGFGAAKNLTKWAFAGDKGEILPEVQALIREMHAQKKPIGAVCMSPAVLAKAFQGTDANIQITVGTSALPSPYDIAAIDAGLRNTGAQPVACSVGELAYDEANKLVTSPCYMMEASIVEVFAGVERVVGKLLALCR